jgi:hypothetical protein
MAATGSTRTLSAAAGMLGMVGDRDTMLDSWLVRTITGGGGGVTSILHCQDELLVMNESQTCVDSFACMIYDGIVDRYIMM